MNKITGYDVSILGSDNTYCAIKDYINALPIPDYFKKNIGNADFVNSNHEFYVNYPYLFLESQSSNDPVVDNLCIAGFLYYQSVIYLDRILDKDISIQQAFPISNICDEEAVKLLSSLFPLTSEYWKLWNVRKVEYLKAYSDDFGGCTMMSFDEFASHADNKSALGKLAIDALY